MTYTLTGKTRYRVETRFMRDPLVVLQVEVDYDEGPPDYMDMPTYLAAKGIWKDATVQDLSMLQMKG